MIDLQKIVSFYAVTTFTPKSHTKRTQVVQGNSYPQKQQTMTKIKGTVKWFSNKKGFGFITPTSENAPTKEDIFVHQSNIVSDAEYRTLVSVAKTESEQSYEVGKDMWKLYLFYVSVAFESMPTNSSSMWFPRFRHQNLKTL